MIKKILSNLFIVAIIVISGGLIVYTNISNNRLSEEKRIKNKEVEHQKAVALLRNSINEFATLSAGIQSFVRCHETFPPESEFQEFYQFLTKDLSVTDSLIISYLDTNHTFIYSFDRFSIDRFNLKGRSVASLRPEKEIVNLNGIMNDENLHLFEPINLVEGWLGLPMNFNVMKNGKSTGYVSQVIHLGSLLDKIYESNNDFVYKFTANGTGFDRAKIYDGTPSYSSVVDPEYYTNYADHDDFIESGINLHGLNLTIGTAYKISPHDGKEITIISFIWFAGVTLLALYLLRQFYTFRILYSKLQETQEIVTYQNKKLGELNSSKDMLFSILSHDIKGPLNSIRSIIDLNTQNLITPEASNRFFKMLKDGVDNTMFLLENIITWSYSNRESIEVKKERIKIKNLLRDIYSLYSDMAAHKQIKFEKQSFEDVDIEGDPNMISTVFRNIIANSIKFTPNKGSINISCKHNEEITSVIIKDDGIGMNEEKLANLFKVKKSKKSSGTNGEMGTGLGMVLCYDLIIKNNGTIRVESEVGVGTTFTVSFPSA